MNCLKFPNSRHDDFVDTIAWIGMGLDRTSTPGGFVNNQHKRFLKLAQWVGSNGEQKNKKSMIECTTKLEAGNARKHNNDHCK